MFSWLPPVSRFLGSPLHAADYFIDILNTDIFRKHSASDSPGSVFHILSHFLCLASEDVADFLYGGRREENKANRAARRAWWDVRERSGLQSQELKIGNNNKINK